jgi:hypothetical protein
MNTDEKHSNIINDIYQELIKVFRSGCKNKLRNSKKIIKKYTSKFIYGGDFIYEGDREDLYYSNGFELLRVVLFGFEIQPGMKNMFIQMKLFKWFSDNNYLNVLNMKGLDKTREKYENNCLKLVKTKIGKCFGVKDLNIINQLCDGGGEWIYFYYLSMNGEHEMICEREILKNTELNIQKNYMKQFIDKFVFEI